MKYNLAVSVVKIAENSFAPGALAMSTEQEKTVERLSRELARIAGLRLRPPRAAQGHIDGLAASPAGELRSRIPPEFFHWRKCPVHHTWLQPELKPFQHWRCAARYPAGSIIPASFRCTFQRPAKLRTAIERRIFAVAAFLEEHA